MPNTFGDIRILKRVDESGVKGDQYDTEDFSFATQGLVGNHFGLSLGVATQHSHSGEGTNRRTNSFYSIEPGIFVPITINRSAINVYGKLDLSTFISKRGTGPGEDWNSLAGWSAGVSYPLYLPQHNLALTFDGSYSNISEIDGSLKEPEWRGLTFSLIPQMLYSPAIKRIARTPTNFQKGTWSLDGSSMLLWSRDLKPEKSQDNLTFGDNAARLTYLTTRMKIKGSYYFLNGVAVHCDIGLVGQNYTSEAPEWSNYKYLYETTESVFHYSLGLRVHPKGPDSDFYLGVSAGRKVARYEEREESPDWVHGDLAKNTDGLLYQFEMGFYAHVLPSIALDPHIAYGRYSAETGSEFFDNEGLSIGLGIVAFFPTNP